MKRIATIAGSDCSGGAGIQADLKAIALLGGYGMSVVTAVTDQDGRSVRSIHSLPPAVVRAQLETVLAGIGVDAVKTGMLGTARIVGEVVELLSVQRPPVLVVDPVMAASGGASLLSEAGRRLLREKLLPLASLVTPNIPEAEQLSGIAIASPDDMQRAAERICGFGPAAVVVTGGHLAGEPVDVLCDSEQHAVIVMPGPRSGAREAHGSGCTFSAAAATLLAQGHPLTEAVAEAKRLTAAAIEAAVPLGQAAAANQLVWATDLDERQSVLSALEDAYQQLAERRLGWLIPEVRSNLGYARAEARGPEDVAAFPGRLTAVGGRIVALRRPAFGASSHMARVILTARRRYPELRAAMNIRYLPQLLEAAARSGLKVARFDRAAEPDEISLPEGRSLEWGVDAALRASDERPDLVVDQGGLGKEPMIRILATHPAGVVAKVLVLADATDSSDATQEAAP
jgi:hydroxymethylpyrimidine/phosphomethylpyrimidine kinase